MREDRSRRRLTWDRIVVVLLMAGIGGVVAWGASIELQASPLQSRLFAKIASGFAYSVQPGPNPEARFPQGGPNKIK